MVQKSQGQPPFGCIKSCKKCCKSCHKLASSIGEFAAFLSHQLSMIRTLYHWFLPKGICRFGNFWGIVFSRVTFFYSKWWLSQRLCWFIFFYPPNILFGETQKKTSSNVIQKLLLCFFSQRNMGVALLPKHLTYLFPMTSAFGDQNKSVIFLHQRWLRGWFCLGCSSTKVIQWNWEGTPGRYPSKWVP